MTWNIQGASLLDRGERYPVIKEIIEKYLPDILCIQEAFFPKGRKMLESISKYYVSYKKNLFPPLTTKGGLVTLTKTKPVNVSFQPYQTQGNWRTEQKWDKLIGKGFLETIIKHESEGQITIINTHKVCTYSAHPDQYLEDQVGQLAEYLQGKKEGLVIVAGDFNFKRKTHLYPRLRTLLHDATASLGSFHLFAYEQIDYIFLSQEHQHAPQYVSIENNAWKGKYPSDHPGIFVDIKPSNR